MPGVNPSGISPLSAGGFHGGLHFLGEIARPATPHLKTILTGQVCHILPGEIHVLDGLHLLAGHGFLNLIEEAGRLLSRDVIGAAQAVGSFPQGQEGGSLFGSNCLVGFFKGKRAQGKLHGLGQLRLASRDLRLQSLAAAEPLQPARVSAMMEKLITRNKWRSFSCVDFRFNLALWNYPLQLHFLDTMRSSDSHQTPSPLPLSQLWERGVGVRAMASIHSCRKASIGSSWAALLAG